MARAISEHLSVTLSVMTPDQAATLLSRPGAEAISNGTGAALPPPEWLEILDNLRRADGESVYEAHRAARCATDAQLRIANRITEAAAETGAPGAAPYRP